MVVRQAYGAWADYSNTYFQHLVQGDPCIAKKPQPGSSVGPLGSTPGVLISTEYPFRVRHHREQCPPAFEVLVDMARNDPQGLETLRRSLTDAVIAAASSDTTRRRLKGLQFRVDLERQRAATPLAATIRISEMMCHSLAQLHASMVYTAEEQEINELPVAPTGSNIIPFPGSR